MKKLGTVLLLSCLITGCTTTVKKSTSPKIIETIQPQNNIPSFFHLSILKDVNWEESPSFQHDKISVKGIQDKVAIVDATWIANQPNKYMWFFLNSNIPSGKLTVIAIKQGSTKPVPVLFQDEITGNVWTAPQEITKDITSIPSSMLLPSSGLWLLNVYIGEKLYGQIVVHVEEGDKP
ncbi:DUF4871 domain-containing protein [Bacillus sp. AFS018417]|uniref:DUF4871 domain-containing protein n=1 Tax=Bacillus sp. AFS018417 TaxID=2033491 RepID=UPI000BF525AB|nr:DUF4871 domain-containing protein [Bacillus sp. AFS018417]PEZ06347.1 DUF4871 domain-containing protein [Bacillus sp. AFS018417]